MKNLLLFLFTLLLMNAGYGQAPIKFRYQAVARDPNGTVITSTLAMRMSLREDAADGIVRYVETHQAQPNAQGVFDLKIGDGSVVSGDLSLIDWADHQYWIEVEMKSDVDFIKMGTTQLLSVPYALFAAKSGSELSSGQGISIANGVVNNTGDLSNSNELQTLTVNGAQLSISNGNAVTLPTGTTYTEGVGIDINGNVISALDASPTNEMQTLSVNGNQLAITGGNAVTLPAGTTYTEGPGIDINGNSISAIDANTTNELQTISLNGQQLTLSNGGGTVQLPAATSSWNLAGNVLSNVPTTTNVGIGTTTSNGSKLSVSATGSDHAGNFYSPGTGDAVHAYNNGTGAAVSGSSLNGKGGYFTSLSGPAGYFASSSGPGLLVMDGKVGIGVANPTYEFEVEGSGAFWGRDDEDGLTAFTKNPFNFAVKGVGIDGASGAYFSSYGNGRPLMVEAYAFGVGHGITMLANNVAWETYIDGAHDYNFAYENNLKSYIADVDGSYHTFSDSRLKKDIKPYSHVLANLTKLQAYTYHMKDAADDAPISLGFMAQEVAAQFPELVIEKDGYKSLCYDHFAVLSVQAIKEQQLEIETLKQQNQTMQQQIDDLKTAIINLGKK